jgi:hypothetical protein
MMEVSLSADEYEGVTYVFKDLKLSTGFCEKRRNKTCFFFAHIPASIHFYWNSPKAVAATGQDVEAETKTWWARHKNGQFAFWKVGLDTLRTYRAATTRANSIHQPNPIFSLSVDSTCCLTKLQC